MSRKSRKKRVESACVLQRSILFLMHHESYHLSPSPVCISCSAYDNLLAAGAASEANSYTDPRADTVSDTHSSPHAQTFGHTDKQQVITLTLPHSPKPNLATNQ